LSFIEAYETNIQIFGEIDCGRISQEFDKEEIAKFFVVIMALFCLATDNEHANLMISLISNCKEEHKVCLMEFLQNRVFELLEKREEGFALERKKSSNSHDNEIELRKIFQLQMEDERFEAAQAEIQNLLETVRLNNPD